MITSTALKNLIDLPTKILIVDDDPLILDVLGAFIESLGHDYSTALDGQAALEALKQGDYTIVISDMVMPNMGGMTLLAHIRDTYPRIDVIVVTGYAGKFSYTDVINAGASDFISKPFNTDELEAKLNRIIREQQLIAELERLSISDSLTTLYNRRYFDVKLNEEVHRAYRQDYPLYLLMLDVDRFKQYNDAHGHQAGDRVLQSLAKILTQCTRENVDWVFRVGGDEFAMIIPYASKSQAIHVAERILGFYKEYDFIKTGLSIGMASFVRHDHLTWMEDIDYFISRADQALYQSKNDGGNAVICDPEE